MQCPIGVPHAVVFIVSLSGRQLLYRCTSGKCRISTVHVIERMWQKRGTIEGTVKLLFVRLVVRLYFHSGEMPFPDVSQFPMRPFKVPVGNFGSKISQGTFVPGK